MCSTFAYYYTYNKKVVRNRANLLREKTKFLAKKKFCTRTIEPPRPPLPTPLYHRDLELCTVYIALTLNSTCAVHWTPGHIYLNIITVLK